MAAVNPLLATLSGVGSLDAQALRADHVDVALTGLGSATVYATATADLRLSRLGYRVRQAASTPYRSSGLGGITWR